MPELYPIFNMPELAEQQQIEPVPKYGESWLFNFEKGDFILDGAGKILRADGHQAWMQWCVKAVLIERFAYLVYGSNYGCEIKQAQQQPSRQAIEAEAERAITEALLADPRTESVKDFDFYWQGDNLYVAFIVIPVIGTPERLEVKANA